MPSRDPKITVLSYDDIKEWQRQYYYLKKHPDCVSIPPKRISKDPRITVRSRDDRKAYPRQYHYLIKYPDCESIPPRRISKGHKIAYCSLRFT